MCFGDSERAGACARMKKGERVAFDGLYEQYYDKLFRTACMITGSFCGLSFYISKNGAKYNDKNLKNGAKYNKTS